MTIRKRTALLSVLGVALAALLTLLAVVPSGAQVSARPPLYEPPDGSVYSGMFVRLWDSTDPIVGDSRPFAARLQDTIDQELAGRPPAILLVPTTWQRDDGYPIPFENALEDIRRFQDFNGGRIVPFLKWNAQTGYGFSHGGITTKDVVAGKLDTYIRTYARDVREYGKPLFVSPICAEFNGSWWPSCSPSYTKELTAADFVGAWRRTVDIFRAEGATNVAWVWNPDAVGSPDIAPFWPGDDYVDWAGIDMYDSVPPSALEPYYQFAVAHGKPFFIGEWGVRLAGERYVTAAQKREWLEGMFDIFESHPKIKAVVYYNYNQALNHETPEHMGSHTYLYGGQVNYHPNVSNGDSRLVTDSAAGYRATYARRIASSRYLSTIVGPATSTATPTPRPTATPAPTPPPGLEAAQGITVCEEAGLCLR